MSEGVSQKEEHWRRTRSLMILHLVIWFVFSYVTHTFAGSLNEMSFIGFPVGYYMAAQGSLLVFVIQLFVFVRQQDAIDRDCGMAEEE